MTWHYGYLRFYLTFSPFVLLWHVFFFFLYKIGKKGQKTATLYRFCVSFFTVCLKAQKSFNYYIIKLKSKLAFVILRMILFRSDLDLCLLRWVLFHYRFFQFSSGRISVLCPMYSLVFLLLSLWVTLKLVKFVFASLKCVINCSICVFWLLFQLIGLFP